MEWFLFSQILTLIIFVLPEESAVLREWLVFHRAVLIQILDYTRYLQPVLLAWLVPPSDSVNVDLKIHLLDGLWCRILFCRSCKVLCSKVFWWINQLRCLSCILNYVGNSINYCVIWSQLRIFEVAGQWNSVKFNPENSIFLVSICPWISHYGGEVLCGAVVKVLKLLFGLCQRVRILMTWFEGLP